MKFNPQISLGNMIQIACFIASLAAGWAILQAQGKSNTERINRAELAVSGLESRTRLLENQAARADERFTNIISLLARIDGRLERIERSTE